VRRSRMLLTLASYAWVLAFLAIVLFPVVWIGLQSLKSYFDVIAVPPRFVFTPTLANYRSVLADTGFLRAALDSLVVSVGAVTLSLAIGVPFAYAISRFDFRGREDVAFFILSTRMLPAIVVIVPFVQIFSRIGLTDSYAGLILAHVLVCIALVVWVMRGFFNAIPIELDEAAIVDGASPLRTFFSIVLPLARPGLVSVASLSFLLSWNEFLFALSLTSFDVRTLPVFMATEFIGFLAVDWARLSAAGIMATLPIVVMVAVLQRHLVSGLSLGAVK